MPFGVEHDQAARALGRGGAVLARGAADDDPAAPQHRHGGAEPDAAGAAGEVARQRGERRHRPALRAIGDDRRAEPLEVAGIVEIVDEHVALAQAADGGGDDDDGIGVLVAVVGDGGREGDGAAQAGEEPVRALGAGTGGRGQRREDDQAGGAAAERHGVPLPERWRPNLQLRVTRI